MNKKKLISMGIIGLSLISLLNMPNKALASTECIPIEESEVKYVNSTFVNINPEEYNSRLRGISAADYYNLWTNEKKSVYDEKSILFGSTEGRVRGGFHNGFSSPGVAVTNNGVIQGLIKSKLENNNLVVSDQYNNGDTLFPTSEGRGYDEVLANWKFPFKKEKNGYYSFNSDEYHVTRDYNNKTFKLHSGGRGGFYPFNKCDDDTIANESIRDLFFTARIDIPFLMTSDGKIVNSETKEKEDMVFNFSGDDDVWIFVDDNLVLDLGGTHYRQSANINFATNKMFISSIQNINGTHRDNVISNAFPNGRLKQGNHTLTVFYMERAGGASNLLTTFNLQSSGIEARYIDKMTDTILDKEIYSGPIGNKVNVEAKELKGYTLVEAPETLEYTLTDGPQVVNFYYLRNATITAKYVDEADKAEISDEDIKVYKEGDKYTTIQKDISNYTFSRVVGKPEGIVGRADLSIKYYYKYNCELKVNYIDKTTGEIIDSEIKQGLEGEKISIKHREFENYRLVEGPEEGTKYQFNKKEQEVNYYYKYVGKVKVNYIVQESQEVLNEYLIQDLEGTDINTQSKEFEGYELIEKPEIEKCTIDRSLIEMNYYYKKLLFNLKVDMNMEKSVINQNYFSLRGKIGKIEMRIKEANKNATCKIYYIVRVANTENRSGSGKLVERIPVNFYMIPEENSGWNISDNEATIDVANIKGGEWREYKLVLTKKEGIDVSQTVSNNIEIISTSHEETNKDDNKDNNDLVILPRTGMLIKFVKNKYAVLASGSIVLITIVVLIFRFRYKSRNLVK